MRAIGPVVLMTVVVCVAALRCAQAGEPTPGATIQRHGIPSETPTPPPPPPTPTPIPCDCDGNHVVRIHELVQAAALLLGDGSSETCGGMDGNRDGRLTIDELVVGVLHALYGCQALAVPESVFGANVFFGPAVIFYGPAVVGQDLTGRLDVSVRYGLSRSISASGYPNGAGIFAMSGHSVDGAAREPVHGTAELEVIDDALLLQVYFPRQSAETLSLRLVREMGGTPARWSGLYDLELRGEGEPQAFELAIAVPPSGFAACDGAPAGGLRDGACQIAPSGGFHFDTVLPSGLAITLLGLIEDGEQGIVAHGTWGASGRQGTPVGTWTATKRPDA